MGFGQTMSVPPYLLPTFSFGGISAGTVKQSKTDAQEEIFKKKADELDAAAQKAQDEYLKKMKYIGLRAQSEEVTQNIRKQEEDAQRAYNQLQKSKNAQGGARVDSGKKGFLRWVSNAGTALWNMGKSIVGFDKNGKWNPVKCITNIAITAAAIGATFIPYVGPAIGYGLLATGVIGGGIGVAKGLKNLDEAEKSGDQAKIDAAQQDVCGSAFIGITSALGLRGIGKAFRTSSATAEAASSASTTAPKVVQSLSNFGRDISVNALRGTKAAMSADKALIASNGGTWAAFKAKVTSSYNKNAGSWEKQYNIQKQEMEATLNNKLSDINARIAAETDPAKQALLQQEKQLLEANIAEFRTIGNSIKSKADFDKLSTDNMAQFNQEYVQNGFNKAASGEFEVGGTLVKEQEFLAFQRRISQQQRALDKELQKLIKAKENMMRTYATKPDKYRTQLNEYISTSGIKRSKLNIGHWIRNDYELALGGKNPSSTGFMLGTALTTPGSNAAKASGAWIDPIHSGAILLTAELSPEETQAQLESMEKAIEVVKNVRIKLETAQNEEELTQALLEYQQLVSAAQGQAPTQEQAAAQTQEQAQQ